MTQPKPTAEEVSSWQKRLAAQANNQAWRLSESTSRSPAESEEMLHAAHAAMYFWSIVGNPGNRAHAAQLLAHVYALLGRGEDAAAYLSASSAHFANTDCAPWEVAISHAVAANVAASLNDRLRHEEHYEKARDLIAALPDPEDRNILLPTLNVVPVPGGTDEVSG